MAGFKPVLFCSPWCQSIFGVELAAARARCGLAQIGEGGGRHGGQVRSQTPHHLRARGATAERGGIPPLHQHVCWLWCCHQHRRISPFLILWLVQEGESPSHMSNSVSKQPYWYLRLCSGSGTHITTQLESPGAVARWKWTHDLGNDFPARRDR
ncbi:hypothetical protein B0T25DRAFT_63684 [Lasiosphaeria hispida]|uniref:Uncharacterized protein n=1 Tax=Lasiosphaeria hispida TaxID=260671 RepID=A0AAJ0ML44_9PEZI|nr:hypothetical protein B0T25DRAFT_63684 [Lasiosphaeria hispida]